MEIKVLWNTKVGMEIFQSPDFRLLPQKACSISFVYDDNGIDVSVSMLFTSVGSISICHEPMIPIHAISESYEKLIESDATEYYDFCVNRSSDSTMLMKSFSIHFDGGPLYEIIAMDVQITISPVR